MRLRPASAPLQINSPHSAAVGAAPETYIVKALRIMYFGFLYGTVQQADRGGTCLW